MVKMSTIRTLISLTMNKDWKLHKLDVKNVFLNGELMEEEYMDIPPSFSAIQTIGKVCIVRKSLYGLKWPPQASLWWVWDTNISMRTLHSFSDNTRSILHYLLHMWMI